MNTQLFIKKSMMVLLTLITLFSLVAPVTARRVGAVSDKNMPVVSSQAQGPTDPAELEAFLDELMAKDMEEYNIPGAAVSVVKDGVLYFAKGYGYADLENKIPVDAEETIFPTGSVGKLFTWTAVMQLAEQGKLNLDADVNTYLDFSIPDTYPQPITLKHLMTHTAGFEELAFETFSWDAEGLLPVDQWLATHLPARVRPPGEIAAYSNYGAMLAGYIVARTSGQSYEQYIQEHIFDPLRMERSFTLLLIPPDLRTHISKGYWNVDGVSQTVPTVPDDFMVQAATVPEGVIFTSVPDMARFMIVHLQDGFYGDASTGMRILEENTARQMHNTLYSPDQRIQGAAYGFFDFSDNGQRTLGHTGGALGYTTMLLLLPDQDLGVYVVYNHVVGGRLTTQHTGFQRAFFDHYYPAPTVEPIQPSVDFTERAGQFTGTYRSTSGPYMTLERFGILMGQTAEIRDLGNGVLLFSDRGAEVRLAEVEPLYFRQVDGSFDVVFREDDQGQITHMFTDIVPQYSYEKLNWYETAGFNMALFLGCVLVFLSMILVALVRAIRNRHPSGVRKPASLGARAANWIIVTISILNLLFVAGVARMFFSLGFPFFGVSLMDKIVLGLGVVCALLTVGALVYTLLAWKDRYWGVAFRAYYTLVTVAAVAFVWFLNFWNLLGWRY